MNLRSMFPVPAGYRREFLFEDKESGYQERLVISGSGIELEGSDEGIANTSHRVQSLVLDWMEESIVAVRKELGQL